MEVAVTIESVNPTEQVSDRFKKREFVGVIDAKGKYPQPVLFTLCQDKCSLADGLTPGEEVTVHFNLKGRKWENGIEVRYFNQVEAWKLDKI